MECRQKSITQANWSLEQEGKEKLSSLRELKEKITESKTLLNIQGEQFREISFLRNRELEYRKQIIQLIDKLGRQSMPDEELEEAQKQYLYTKFILLPHLRSSIQKLAKAFENKFKEKIPLIIDTETVTKLFPLLP